MSQRISAQRMSWGLLALSFLLLAFGLGVLALRSSQTGVTQSVLQPLTYLPWVAAVAAAAMFLQAMLLRCRVSPWLLPFSFFFASVGLVEIARLKPILFIPQLRWLLIGMTAFLVVLRCGRSIVELTSYQYPKSGCA
ncbi:MAG: FtsW/RodA/SpoVE family cell cycle protein, partial [Selenomonas sp.]|nr:FtsW/RodA/SpoVE family cell cycle protein [Selenomonas sp.]